VSPRACSRSTSEMCAPEHVPGRSSTTAHGSTTAAQPAETPAPLMASTFMVTQTRQPRPKNFSNTLSRTVTANGEDPYIDASTMPRGWVRYFPAQVPRPPSRSSMILDAAVSPSFRSAWATTRSAATTRGTAMSPRHGAQAIPPSPPRLRERCSKSDHRTRSGRVADGWPVRPGRRRTRTVRREDYRHLSSPTGH
jgi:hypothetical protein